MNRPSIKTLVVAALAAHRLARLVAVDTITEPLRDRALEWLDKPVMKHPRILGQSSALDEVNVPATTVKEYVGEMIECPHCAGFHMSWMALGAYTLSRRRGWWWVGFAVEVFAVAGVQSTLASAQAALETLGHIDPDDVNDANEAEARNN